MGDVQVTYGVTNVRQNTQSATQPFLGSSRNAPPYVSVA